MSSVTENASAAVYDAKYSSGYLDNSWSAEKKERIANVIRSLPLPGAGRALDFGCGNGEITAVLRAALPPEWQVVGTDISRQAIVDARRRRPNCEFLLTGETSFNEQFDLVFSHHVLEHVESLTESFAAMSPLVSSSGMMLHILPCGNRGSFEHDICSMVKNGIESEHGNRFFFEDPTHLRRVTTDDIAHVSAVHGFEIYREYYSNQYYGALNWITRSTPAVVLQLTNYRRAAGAAARRRLRRLRAGLLFLWAARIPAAFVELRTQRKRKRWIDYPLLASGMFLYPLSLPWDLWIKWRAQREWGQRKTDRNGSEMYVALARKYGGV